MVASYFAEYAWLPGGLAEDVRIDVHDGRIASVTVSEPVRSGDHYLDGLTLPGFANTHSHAFQRALRGRTHGESTFGHWRRRMYSLAARINPDNYLALARATYAEMALAGISAVGEFHYLHHGPGGQRYSDPNAMTNALIQAAGEAGIRITVLDACYVSGGLGADGPLPVAPEQQSFSDGDADGWAARFAGLAELPPHGRLGAAIHSVRAVPRAQLATVVAAANGRPLHVHVSEQREENEQSHAAYGRSPAQVLADAGALGHTTTAVHATWLTVEDIVLLGGSGTAISMCPTTERDLADGIGPAWELKQAGSPIALGSDQHGVTDLLEEARSLEMDERLANHERGRFRVEGLVRALTRDGHRSLGWDDAGRIDIGARADLTSIRLDTPRTAGAAPDQVLFAATAADVDTVVVDGQVVVEEGRHRLGDVGQLLAEAITPLWD